MFTALWTDRFGGLASASCAAHCLLMTFLPSLLPVLGLGFLADEVFEWALFVMAISLALLAALLGYRAHRTRWVVAGLGVGALVLVAGRLGEALALFEGGSLVSIAGGALLAGTHLASMARTRAALGAAAA